ncbi:S41 family peptidase, partial [Bacteroidota bacterium]
MVKTKLLILISSFILLTGCEDMIIESPDSNQNMEDFEAAWERIKTVYPYLEFKEISWDSLYLVYKPRAEQAKGDEIYTLLIDMLGELKDMHVYVKTDGGRVIQTHLAPRWVKDKYAFSPIVVRNYFDKELKITGKGRIEYEIIPGNIGYIYIGTFDDDYVIEYFSEALEYVKNTKALILDIRHNNGGSFQNLEAAVSRFITAPLELPELRIL